MSHCCNLHIYPSGLRSNKEGEVKVSQALLVIRAVPRLTAGQVLKEPVSNPRGANNVFTVITLKATVIPGGYDVMCLW